MFNRKWGSSFTFITLILAVFLWSHQASASSVASTKHNLSATGPGTFKAATEQRVCAFCHTPHNADPADPLWNHVSSGSTYTPYSSDTMAQAAPGQPSGTSKLCLSCHDGTIALGSVHNLPENMGAGTITGLGSALTGPTLLSTDLSDDHPISFTYDAALVVKNTELVNPAVAGASLPLYGLGKNQVECASCHNPHESVNPKFLRMGYTDGSGFGSPLCRACHDKAYWTASTHNNSTATWNGAGTNPWHLEGHNQPNDAANSTLKANGCENCHKPHDGGGARILLKQDGESGACLVCHNGNVSTWNIDQALSSMYAHPVKDPLRAGRHKPKRMPDGKIREDQADLNNRHVECFDCHNPHAMTAGVSPNVGDIGGTNNLASNVLKGVWGVEPTWPGNWADVTSYSEVDDIQFQYQLCFKCHSYYAFGLTPPFDPYGKMWGTGQLTDQAKEFNPSNASYHPVVAAGKNNFFAENASGGSYDYSSSLIGNLTPNSTMTCVDCHSNSGYEGTGQKGPHGTDVWPILWAPYDETTGMTGTFDHICFKCHEPAVYGGPGGSQWDWNRTGFSTGVGGKNLHYRHVVLRDAPCTSCHSAIPHGMKRRAMLVYGLGDNPDTLPYMNHSEIPPVNGSTVYGINSSVPVDSIPSGSWRRSDCHNAPGGGVGSC